MKNHVSNPPPKPASDAVSSEPVTPRRGWPYAAIAAAGVVGIAGGLAAGLFIPSPVAEAETVTPAACIEAIDIADEALAITSGSLGTIADAFTALADGNELLADIIMSDLDGDTDDIANLKDDYHAAKDECRASHD